MARSLEEIAAELDGMADVFYEMAGTFAKEGTDPTHTSVKLFNESGQSFDLRALAKELREHARKEA